MRIALLCNLVRVDFFLPVRVGLTEMISCTSEVNYLLYVLFIFF